MSSPLERFKQNNHGRSTQEESTGESSLTLVLVSEHQPCLPREADMFSELVVDLDNVDLWHNNEKSWKDVLK